MLKTIFVSIGNPKNSVAFYDKVACNVQTDTQTDIQVAKLLRKRVCEDFRYKKPSELYYEIYQRLTIWDQGEALFESRPYAASANSPYMNMR